MVALSTTAITAFHPKVAKMKALSHCQVAATINTGDAAMTITTKTNRGSV